jgi:formylglycine-generating enzyme required for sulfatase activity
VSFQQSGLTKRASATPLGQHANVAAIVFAQVSKAGERYDRSGYNLTLKVVDVATNRVVWTESGALGKGDREVVGVTGRIARRLAFMALSFSPAEMVFVPAGSLHMGSKAGLPDEQPVHLISVSAFSLDRTEVSTAAYNAYLIADGRKATPRIASELPATMVSWHDARAYCGQLDKRLPTEAEWEYAARGTTNTTYPWGEASPGPDLASYGGSSAQPVAVDALTQGANAQGVLHLAGNVAEWVGDW